MSIPQAEAEIVRPHGIVLDGTIGTAGKNELQGPDFEIIPEYGEQQGRNLFHSFQKFNLYANESATFTGPETVQNIISRVTGGESSWINGKIASEIPHANLYLLNPAGVMFGPDSSLDIEGSFHVSTAAYLNLGKMDRFYSNTSLNSVLTSSPPIAFGFLDNNFSSITLEGEGEIQAENIENQTTGLVVKNGRTISFISGEIEIKNGSFYRTKEIRYDYFDQPHETDVSIKLGSLTAPQGQINLISVTSPSEVNINEVDTSLSNHSGSIHILDKSILDVNSGNIYILGGDILIKDSVIKANTTGENNGGTVDIQANNISFINGSRILITNHGNGFGSGINLNASENIIFSGENEYGESSIIDAASESIDDNGGDSGDIVIQAENITFSDGATIIGNAYGGGKGSDITLKASSSVKLFQSNTQGEVSKIFLNTYSTSEKAGHGGNITIDAKDIVFENGASIYSMTFGHGNLGTVSLTAEKQIDFSGINNEPFFIYLKKRMFDDNSKRNPGGIFSIVLPWSNGGNCGKISIKGGDITLNNTSMILSDTYGPGNSNNISIIAEESLIVNGSIDTNFLRSQISSSSMPIGPVVGGDSGDISIQTKHLLLSNGGYITTSTTGFYAIQSGCAGNIHLDVSGTIKISGVNPYGTISSDILASSGIYVGSGGLNNTGEAGNILLESGKLIIEKGGKIGGNTIGNISGGEIDIRVTDLISITGDSSSEKFIPGKGIQIVQSSGFFSTSLGYDKDTGSSGRIFLSTDLLLLGDKGEISTSSEGGGNAGNITLDLNNCILRNDAQISSASNNDTYGGLAGTIHIDADDSIHILDNSKLTTEAVNSIINNNNDSLSGKISLSPGRLLFLSNSEISTSVQGGNGKGGDIDISQPKFVALNKSKIIANAYKGSGGNILINSEQFIQSSDSIVSASSRLGVNGNINITSPVVNIAEDLTFIVENNMDVEQWVKTPCEARTAKNVSRFFIKNLDASPIDYYDWWLTSKDYELNQPAKDTHIDQKLVNDYLKKFLDYFETY
jgi:filamentous hemagglutinin family protein